MNETATDRYQENAVAVEMAVNEKKRKKTSNIQSYKDCDFCGKNLNTKSMAQHVRTQHEKSQGPAKRKPKLILDPPSTNTETKKVRKCGLCFETGHYRTKCPKK